MMGTEDSLPPLMTKDGKIVGQLTRSGRVKALPPLKDEPGRTWIAAVMAPIVVGSDGYVLSYTEDDGTVVNLPAPGKSVEP
ncbi:MAG: hypothetical protein FD153_19 [Rhodospirillaceae bacterium]|nr:MAG: hypothetical protein FD153_19 [Rhodospirillaceae bacterium]